MMRIIKYLFIAVIAFLIILYLEHKKPYLIVSGQTFGTYYTIKIRSPKNSKFIQHIIKEEFTKIDDEMSVFNPHSEISDINHETSGAWIALSPELSNLFKNAHQIYKMSGGAFDPTTGKLINLWGFGTSGNAQKIPEQSEIDEVLKTTGFDKIDFDKNYEKLRKKFPETMINLSAIAKGYAVDRVAELLKKNDYKNFVIEIGGEVYAHGKRSEDIKGWNIGIVNPENNNEVNAFVITLKNFAAATSGDYRNFFYIDGKKYSHTIDPKTGYPAENTLTSVTVFDKSCAKADGLATAIMSMGEKKASAFIKQNNLPVVMFTKDENGKLESWVSPAAISLGVR